MMRAKNKTHKYNENKRKENGEAYAQKERVINRFSIVCENRWERASECFHLKKHIPALALRLPLLNTLSVR
jgi:hypothetical protein